MVQAELSVLMLRTNFTAAPGTSAPCQAGTEQAEMFTGPTDTGIFISRSQKSELSIPEPSPEGTNTSITMTALEACPEQGQDTLETLGKQNIKQPSTA